MKTALVSLLLVLGSPSAHATTALDDAERMIAAARIQPPQEKFTIAHVDMTQEATITPDDSDGEFPGEGWPQMGLRVTSDSLDLGIFGDGFFWLIDPFTGALRATRNGVFKVDVNGYLVHWERGDHLLRKTRQGFADIRITDFATSRSVQTGEVIRLQRLQATADGRIIAVYEDSTQIEVARLAIVSFASPRRLRRVGHDLFEATEASGLPTLSASSKVLGYATEVSDERFLRLVGQP